MRQKDIKLFLDIHKELVSCSNLFSTLVSNKLAESVPEKKPKIQKLLTEYVDGVLSKDDTAWEISDIFSTCNLEGVYFRLNDVTCQCGGEGNVFEGDIADDFSFRVNCRSCGNEIVRMTDDKEEKEGIFNALHEA